MAIIYECDGCKITTKDYKIRDTWAEFMYKYRTMPYRARKLLVVLCPNCFKKLEKFINEGL